MIHPAWASSREMTNCTVCVYIYIEHPAFERPKATSHPLTIHIAERSGAVDISEHKVPCDSERIRLSQSPKWRRSCCFPLTPANKKPAPLKKTPLMSVWPGPKTPRAMETSSAHVGAFPKTRSCVEVKTLENHRMKPDFLHLGLDQKVLYTGKKDDVRHQMGKLTHGHLGARRSTPPISLNLSISHQLPQGGTGHIPEVWNCRTMASPDGRFGVQPKSSYE